MEKLIKDLESIAGTQTYIPVTDNGSVLVFMNLGGYYHIFYRLSSVFGACQAKDVAKRLYEMHEAGTITLSEVYR